MNQKHFDRCKCPCHSEDAEPAIKYHPNGICCTKCHICGDNIAVGRKLPHLEFHTKQKETKNIDECTSK
jgi:hypothetical protein